MSSEEQFETPNGVDPEFDNPVASEPVVETEQETQAEVERKRDLVERFKDRYEFDEDYDDDDLLNDIEANMDDVRQFQESKPDFEAFISERDAYLQWKQEQSAPKKEEPAKPAVQEPVVDQVDTDPLKAFWNPPEVDPYVESQANTGIQRGDIKVDSRTGLLETTKPALRSTVDAINKRTEYKNKFLTDFYANPVEMIAKIAAVNKPKELEEFKTLKEWQSQIEAERAEQKAKQSQSQLEEKARQAYGKIVLESKQDWYVLDESGNPVVDEATGEYQVTEKHEDLLMQFDFLRETVPGIDSLQALEDAKKYIDKKYAGKKPAEEKPVETKAEKKQRWVSGSKAKKPDVPTRSVPDGNIPSTKNAARMESVGRISFSDMAKETRSQLNGTTRN